MTFDSKKNYSYEPVLCSDSKTQMTFDSKTNDSYEPFLLSESKTNSAISSCVPNDTPYVLTVCTSTLSRFFS